MDQRVEGVARRAAVGPKRSHCSTQVDRFEDAHRVSLFAREPSAQLPLHSELQSASALAKANRVYVMDDEEAQVTGTVVRLNYALHGDVNE
jgi:hypothetical protein